MGPGARKDTQNGFFLALNWRKTIWLGIYLPFTVPSQLIHRSGKSISSKLWENKYTVKCLDSSGKRTHRERGGWWRLRVGRVGNISGMWGITIYVERRRLKRTSSLS
jgi:hypothetical protein